MFTPTSNAQSIVLGQAGESEGVDYVLSRYLFAKDVELRTQIQEKHLSTNNDPTLVWKLKTFTAYDSSLSRNFIAAKRLLEEAVGLKPNSPYANLATGCLASYILLKSGNPDSAVYNLEPLIYSPKTFEDSALYYHVSVLLTKAYEKMYDAPNLLKWAYRGLKIKELALDEDLDYKDYRSIGFAYDRNENVDSALYYYDYSNRLAIEQTDSAGMFMSNMDLGIFLSERGDRIEALVHFAECEKYLAAVSLRTQAAFHINCNIDYRKVERMELARNHLIKAEKLGLEISDVDILGHVYQNWVAQYGQEGILDSVPFYINKSEQLFKESNNQYGLGNLYHDKGHYYDNKGNLDSALYWYDQAAKCFEKINYGVGMNNSRLEKFITLINFKKYAQAKLIGEALIEPSRALEDLADIMDLQFGLSKIYKSEGSFKKALQSFEEANLIEDSLAGDEANRKVSMLQIKLEQSKRIQIEKERDLEHELYEATSKELAFDKKLMMLMLVLLIVFLASLIFVLWFWYQSKLTRKN